MTYNQIIKFLKNTPRPNGRKYDLYRAFAEKTNEDISYLKAVIIDDGFRYKPDEDDLDFILEDDTEKLTKIISNIKSVFKKHNVPYYGTGYVRGSLRDDPRYAVAELHPYFAKPGENHYTILDEKIGLKESSDVVSDFLKLCEGK